VCGKQGACGGDDTVAENSIPQEVRCCSETMIPGWRKRPGCSVWAHSRLGYDDRVCHNEKDFATAESICVANNGRLCTKEELENNCAKGTGCGFDSQFVWSSTPDELAPTSHYFAVCGKFLRCTEREGEYAVDAEHEVRCCAESQIDGTFIKKSSCDVWASSKTVLGRCSSNASHSFATSACSGIGARLCTVDELNGNCSSGSGCQFDRAIVWTSTVADSQ